MRKLFFLSLLLMAISSKSFSQFRGKEDINFPKAELVSPNGEITQIKQAPRIIGQVPGVVGANYSSEDIFNLPTRNINKISCMTLGVQTNYGQDPIFRGALGGTAYFVDGIRVRSGNLALAGFTY